MNQFLCFLWGFAGAAFEKTVFWAALIHDPQFPTFAKTRKYWVVTGLLVLFGGIIACAVASSDPSKASALQCFIVGYSCVSLIKQLAKLPPPGAEAGAGGPGSNPPPPTLIDFLRK